MVNRESLDRIQRFLEDEVEDGKNRYQGKVGDARLIVLQMAAFICNCFGNCVDTLSRWYMMSMVLMFTKSTLVN